MNSLPRSGKALPAWLARPSWTGKRNAPGLQRARFADQDGGARLGVAFRSRGLQVSDQVFQGRLTQGARIQVRVLGALIVRELHTRFGRDNIGFLWFIVEPMLLAVGVALAQ